MLNKMRQIVLALTMSVAGVLVASGGEPTSQPGSEAAETPERLMLTVPGDPTTTMAATWRTADYLGHAEAQITPARPDPNLADGAETVFADVQRVSLDDGQTAFYHTAIFSNLEPNTPYAYRVGGGQVWSEWNQFRTAADSPAPFRFIYLGDAQNDILSSCSRVFRAAFAKAGDAALIVHAGDLVDNGDKNESWRQWFEAGGWMFRQVPSLAAIGNHEQPDVDKADPNKGRFLGRFWRPQFAFPGNGPTGQEELAYVTDYQGVRFVVLNGTLATADQAQWVEKYLADNPNKWTIVVIHQALYSSGKDRDLVDLRQAYTPLFDKYHVDLVLQGHDHTYARTFKLRAGQEVGDTESGTVYCTTVCGTKVYPINPRFRGLMRMMGQNMQLFQVISVTDDSLRYEAWTVDGQIFDKFELSKAAHGPGVLMETIPATQPASAPAQETTTRQKAAHGPE